MRSLICFPTSEQLEIRLVLTAAQVSASGFFGWECKVLTRRLVKANTSQHPDSSWAEDIRIMISTDMPFAQVAGITSIAAGYPTHIPQPPTYPNYPPVAQRPHQVITSAPNEMTEPLTGPTYIRRVGATPGTHARLQRIVAKQRSCYGISTFHFVLAKIESTTGSNLARCRFSLPYQLRTSNP